MTNMFRNMLLLVCHISVKCPSISGNGTHKLWCVAEEVPVLLGSNRSLICVFSGCRADICQVVVFCFATPHCKTMFFFPAFWRNVLPPCVRCMNLVQVNAEVIASRLCVSYIQRCKSFSQSGFLSQSLHEPNQISLKMEVEPSSETS